MRCSKCGAQDTRVVDSRIAGDAIRRRRECLVCAERFTTHERADERRLTVLKKEGHRESFSRGKVLAGLALACRKRPFDTDRLNALVDTVIARLQSHSSGTVSSAEVGEAVMTVLREEDDVAYVRFASVYRAFESVDQFIEAIAPLRASR